jgi:hypothetical protein
MAEDGPGQPPLMGGLAGNGECENGVVDELDRHVLALPEDHGNSPSVDVGAAQPKRCGGRHHQDSGRGVARTLTGRRFAELPDHHREGATIASTVTYLLPVVAIILGVLVLDERITFAIIAGIALVLLGVALT